jgi:hypothetical protein
VPPAGTVTVWARRLYPSRRATTSRDPAGTPVIAYSPLGPVTAPIVVPVTVTCTSGAGRCDAASITRPEIVPVAWAPAAVAPTPTSTVTRRTILVMPKAIALLLRCTRKGSVRSPADLHRRLVARVRLCYAGTERAQG